MSNSATIEKLTKELYEVIAKQEANGLNDYDFHFYQERRYRISEKIEELLPEPKRLALWLQRRFYKSRPEEAVAWLSESHNLIHDWDAPLHQKYLWQAQRLLRIADMEKIQKIADVLLR